MVLGALGRFKEEWEGAGGANLSFSQGAWEVSYGPPEIMETIITNVCWSGGGGGVGEGGRRGAEGSQWKRRVGASGEMGSGWGRGGLYL